MFKQYKKKQFKKTNLRIKLIYKYLKKTTLVLHENK